MLLPEPQYVTDSIGNKVAVIIPISTYKSILEELEELEDITLYDEAIKCTEPSVPIDLAFEILDARREAN